MILGDQYQHLHFMGIGGSGISSAVQFAVAAGRTVSGCDCHLASSAYLSQLAGVTLWHGHDPAHLDGCDALVIGPAVRVLDPDNAELRAAEERGLPIITWQELLAQLMADRCVVSVAGVHGKGTTTSLLALMLIAAGYDPACEIGALVPQLGGNNARLGGGSLFVHEADEFNHNFWHYHPRLAVITSLEFEHPEFFADFETYLAAFEHFVLGMELCSHWPLPPTLILHGDSAGCRALRERLPAALAVEVVVVACEGPADYRAVNIRCSDALTTFTVLKAGHVLGSFASRLPGRHNVENALCAIAAADRCGVPVAVMREVLAGFGGLRRRFEIRETRAGITLVDDYAHHPTAVALTIGAARARFAGRRLIAVYQPHLFSRTKAFLAGYASAFDAADVAGIMDIFPARERDTGLVHAAVVAEALRARPAFAHRPAAVRYSGGLAETGAWLRETARPGDVVLLMGAGDIAQLTDSLHQELERRQAEPRATLPAGAVR
ncbi:MAG TPA: UDP-N-acetylmuramate--L-alanine ligase [Ktedonobacterales bacterium]